MPATGVTNLIEHGPRPSARQVHMVLSPHSLPYACLALSSLLSNAREPLELHLITDSHADKTTLVDAVAELQAPSHHIVSVFAEDELADAEASRFARYHRLRAFRHGHPCWRKITDPLLLSDAGSELILLDPDLYFPNPFSFEATPPTGLLLMWQRPNCLLPPEIVRAAFHANIPLARHVDIGVSHWRESSADLDWIDWLLGKLSGGGMLPRLMHVEAIVWAAIALHGGGGYLDPRLWVCWHRTQARRLRRKLGVSGQSILAAEPWATMKSFHAGGEAKWWVPEVAASLTQAADALTSAGRVQPFVELTSARYEQEQRGKALIRGLGYYRFFGQKTA